MIPVECYFALSALLFFIGVYGFVTRRNLIAMLISVDGCGYCYYHQCLPQLP